VDEAQVATDSVGSELTHANHRYALPRDLGERVDVLRVVKLLVDNLAVVASKSCHNFVVSTVYPSGHAS
jgi:hypothetical protein